MCRGGRTQFSLRDSPQAVSLCSTDYRGNSNQTPLVLLVCFSPNFCFHSMFSLGKRGLNWKETQEDGEVSGFGVHDVKFPKYQ